MPVGLFDATAPARGMVNRPARAIGSLAGRRRIMRVLQDADGPKVRKACIPVVTKDQRLPPVAHKDPYVMGQMQLFHRFSPSTRRPHGWSDHASRALTHVKNASESLIEVKAASAQGH